MDTDAVSNLQKGLLRADYKAIVDTYDLVAITWITEAEWRFGLALQNNPKRQASFEKWMQKVLHVGQDGEVTKRWAELSAIAKQHNVSIKKRQNDLWIAATAVRHDLPLMTLNRTDFAVLAEHAGLRLEPPS